jgi:energy-coupling factor transporter ATP-binding protein EcfA2
MSRNLPDWLDGFMQLTENSEPPILFRKWAGISTIASALQRKVRVDLGLSLTFYPNLYVVLVGPSATGKGTVMKFASDIIEQVPSIRLSAQATSLQALIRRMKETNLTDIDLATGEQQYHSSLTIFSTEFTVFLGYHNKELIAALCEWYDCHSRWSYETIARKKEEVIGVWVNIFAGTTPDSIQASLPIESIGGGLTSRIIFVVEERRGKLVIIPTKTEEEIILQQALVNDLEMISMLSGRLQYTKDFIDFYTKWCQDAASNPPFYDKKFDGYCGRRRKHLLTLSMVCSASRSDDMIMSVDDIKRAAYLLTEVEMKMGTVFKGMGRSDISALINDAIVFVTNSRTPDIPLWQFAKHFEGDMDKFVMDRVLVTLETMGLVQLIKRPGMDTVIHIKNI